MSNNLSFRTILTDCKLNDTNFLDWHRNVLIVLTHEKIEYVLDGPMPQESEPTAPAAVRNAYKKHKDDNREVSCIMVASMTPQLQQQHMNMGACKMAEGAPVAPHVLKIIGLIEKLAELGFKMDQEPNVDLVLQSLPDSFSQFVMNYQMNNLQHTLPQLLNVLKTAEKEIKKGKGSTGVLVVTFSKKRKRQEKGFKKSKNKPTQKPKKAKVIKLDIGKGTASHTWRA
ncbi:uncharacterized protein [Coffea arabica]|uniref:Uncharacterized protein n=1 Tax=Coffea arabica TaxID=13443 RepID=A0A6P6XNX1_COFAR|nr:uncharacterized protein LOC113743964 [Coffea arabica]